MATKSFTEEYRFTKKNANSLINALSNDKSPRKQLVTNLKVIDDKEKIKNIFSFFISSLVIISLEHNQFSKIYY